MAVISRRIRRRQGRTVAAARWTLAALTALVICGAVVGAAFWRRSDRGPAAPFVEQAIARPVAPAAAPLVHDAAPRDAGRSHEAPARGQQFRRIGGRVTTQDGEPLPGALVAWLPRSCEELGPLGYDGSFLAGVLGEEPGDADQAEAPGRSSPAAKVLTHAGAGGAYELELPLEPPGALLAWSEGFAMELRSTGASGEGSEVLVLVQEASDPQRQADLQIDFTLAPGGTIAGTVLVTGTREPAAGVVVTATRVDPDGGGSAAVGGGSTGQGLVELDGSFHLTGLPLGLYLVAPESGETDFVPSSTTAASRVALTAELPSATASFEVEPGAALLGTVLGPHGQPFAGAECLAVPASWLGETISSDPTRFASLVKQSFLSAEDGTFELRALPAGEEYIVAARAQGHPLATARVEVPPLGRQVRVKLQLERGWKILGRVVHPDDTLAAGVQVRILPPRVDSAAELSYGSIESFLGAGESATTDAAGSFVLVGLRAGVHSLLAGDASPAALAGRSGASEVVLDGLADATGIELVVEPEDSGAGFLSGFVVDGGGSPIVGTALSVVESEEGIVPHSPIAKVVQTVTGPNGAFQVNGLKDGLHTIVASKQGYLSATLRSVEAPGSRLTLRLTASARLRGKVRLPAEARLPSGGTVIVEPADANGVQESSAEKLSGGGLGQGEILPDGSFDIEATPGSLRLQVRLPGYAPVWSERLFLAPGELREGVEVRLSTGASSLRSISHNPCGRNAFGFSFANP